VSRADDNKVIELWRVQTRLGIKPADRRLPSPSDDYERDLEALRKLLERA